MTFGIFIVYKYAEIISSFGCFVNLSRERGMGNGQQGMVRFDPRSFVLRLNARRLETTFMRQTYVLRLDKRFSSTSGDKRKEGSARKVDISRRHEVAVKSQPILGVA